MERKNYLWLYKLLCKRRSNLNIIETVIIKQDHA